MQKVDSLPGRRWGVVLVSSFLLIVVADQLTKTWVRCYDEGEVIYQLGFFRLAHFQNTGAAFGLFQGQSFALAIFAAVGIVALLALGFFIYRRFPYLISRLNTIAFSLILGGTLGNLIDRLRLGGYVTDFIDIGVWPAFNVADSAITVGAVLVAYSILRLTFFTGRALYLSKK